MKKKIIFVLIVLFVGIQFIRPAKNQSANATTNDISRVYSEPKEVSVILEKPATIATALLKRIIPPTALS